MQKSKLQWANEEHYEKAHKFLEDQGLDSSNEYLYKQLLESKGLTTYTKDLKSWLKSLTTTLNIKDFEL